MKRLSHVQDLALFSKVATFNPPLLVGQPNLGDKKQFQKLLDGAWERRWLTNDGLLVKELEKSLCEKLNVEHCFVVNNATIGLMIAARALELTGEVIMPAFTFIATATAMEWMGLKPVFCDVNRFTHSIDPEEIRKLRTSKTSAVLGVHIWGYPADIDGLQKICSELKLKLFFDAAHAFGSSYQGRSIGNFGELEVFSFHATKSFNTGEGGAIVTNNATLAKKIRLLRAFALEGEKVLASGINGKMSELSAALGLTNLSIMDQVWEANRTNHSHYLKNLKDVDGVRVVIPSQVHSVKHPYVVIEIDESVAGVSRDLLFDILNEEGVKVRRYFFPGCHRQKPFMENGIARSLPNTDAISNAVLTLPTGSTVSPAQVDQVCHIIRFVVEHATEVHSQLNQVKAA